MLFIAGIIIALFIWGFVMSYESGYKKGKAILYGFVSGIAVVVLVVGGLYLIVCVILFILPDSCK
jgi:hypothetical protein